MAKRKKKNPKGQKTERPLLFNLTAEETRTKAIQAADDSISVTTLTAEYKGVQEDWKAKIKNRAASRDDLLSQIREGTEERTVECIAVKNYNQNVVEYWHEGLKIQSREMTKQEREQPDFNFSDDEKKEPKKGIETKGKKTATKKVKTKIRKKTQRKKVAKKKTKGNSKIPGMRGKQGATPADASVH